VSVPPTSTRFAVLAQQFSKPQTPHQVVTEEVGANCVIAAASPVPTWPPGKEPAPRPRFMEGARDEVRRPRGFCAFVFSGVQVSDTSANMQSADEMSQLGVLRFGARRRVEGRGTGLGSGARRRWRLRRALSFGHPSRRQRGRRSTGRGYQTRRRPLQRRGAVERSPPPLPLPSPIGRQVSILAPELGPLAAVMVAPEGGSWTLEEVNVSSSRTNHIDRRARECVCVCERETECVCVCVYTFCYAFWLLHVVGGLDSRQYSLADPVRGPSLTCCCGCQAQCCAG
jgi:hypothetical protein